MFRRTKSSASAVETASDGPATGKGRPTPTRKEAEAAARARAKEALDAKSARGASRAVQVEKSRQVREAIKRGDERYLGTRDKGPVRRFIRDFVDSRVNVAEFTVVLLFIGLAVSAAGQSAYAAAILNTTILLVALDSAWLVFRLRRQLRRRFPEQSTRGTTFYALSRALNMRFMRLPKPQVKPGQQLPEHYS